MFNRREHSNKMVHEIGLIVWVLVLMGFALIFVVMATREADANDSNKDSPPRAWAGWCEARDDLGWHFYCDPEVERRKAEAAAKAQKAISSAPDPAEAVTPPVTDNATSASPSATARIATMRKNLTELRALAILEPTHEHVEAYMREQARFMDMAGAFSDRFRRVLWSTPDLDYESKHPQGNLAKKATQAKLYQTRQSMMAGLNSRYGLIYVGTQKCPVCKIYGPHLRRFAGDWRLTVLAVSADGTPLSGWPEAVPDQGQLAKMRVTRKIVPLTALFDKQTNDVQLLGVGFLADDELIYRIHTITNQETKDAS